MNHLKEVRLQLGWSQARAISAICAESRAAGVEPPGATSLKTQLSRWENGHRAPDGFYRKVLERAYGKPANELGIAPQVHEDSQGLEVGRTPHESALQASNLWDEDMNRRELLRSATFTAAAFAAPTLAALVGASVDPPSRSTGRRVDSHDIEAVQQMTATFSSVDNRHGGGQIRRAAVTYLANDVAPLLNGGHFDSRTGSALFVAAAELTQLVGWMSHDVGSHGLGQRYLIQALSLARSANDATLMAEILAAMSHQSSYLNEGSQAVDLARAARQLASHGGVSAIVAESHVMEAHGYAVLGESTLCAASINAAEKALDTATDRATEPHWIGYFDEAYLSAKFGHCFRVLGDHRNAVSFAERSLNMNQQRYARGQAFNLSLLAHAHAQAGDVDQACHIGHQAVSATSGLRSERAFRYLDGIVTALHPARSEPAVATFNRAVEELRTAA